MSKNQQSFLFQKAGMILNWFRRLCGVTPRKIVFKNKEFKKGIDKALEILGEKND